MQIRDSGIDARSPLWSEVRVACIWLPQLPIRMEVLRHPEWDGRPLVLGSGSGGGKAVQLCSPEADRAGIHPGLPLREVLALCADAIILQPDPVRVAAVFDEILGRLQEVGPAIELAEDRVFLDLRGLHGIYSGALARLEQAIRVAVPALLLPRIGIAGGKAIASIAAHTAPISGARVVSASETAAFLAPLPCSYLPLAADVVQRLHVLGLRRIADLAQLPFDAVQAAFGLSGARAWRLAHGQDDEPVIPHRARSTICASLSFDDPLVSSDAVFVACHHLLAHTFANPALCGRSVRQLRLRALLANRSSWERLITFKEALLSRDAVYRALKGKLELPNALPQAPVEELSLELMELSGEAAKQPNMFLACARQLGQIAEAARQLRARYDDVPLYHAVEVEPWSRIPERRWTLIPYDLS